jgi:hypothetical protein
MFKENPWYNYMPLFSPGNDPKYIGFILKDYDSQNLYFKEEDWIEKKVKSFNVNGYGCD